ncbi:protein GFS12 isoform X1 [Salvia splendens]|uniref:protein GFS12 isoform X1 n=1 Tax=Salvia splendens TaxID=180675 RepID=UPI001C252FC6|nr:protein GFS12 isoform X1 [Salvia splendens]
MDSAAKMCLECLQRRIEADFSGRLTFLHSVSDYRLPFASAAVVQVSNSDLATPPQFVFNYMPYRTTDCFSKYVDEFCVIEGDITESSSTVKQVQAEVSVGISSDTSSDFDTASTECRHFSNGRVLDGCATCKISTRFSCSRAITSLAPTALIGHVSFELFEEIASSFSSGSFEGQLLHSLCQLIEGKSAGRDGANFLSLLGLPSFKENGFPGCIRHPNICPILGVLKSPTDICLVLPKTPFTLENIMHYSPAALQFDWKIQFLIYQLLSALSYLHGLGIAHGNLSPSNILLTDTSWCWLQISEKQLLNTALDPSGKSLELSAGSHCFEGCPSHALYADLSLLNSVNWQSCFYSWWKGELSNFEYLLVLNRLAGRRWGDHTFYSVMPWVIDFSVKPDENNIAGWRDLSKSKWRLAKGDEQLDFTYSTSEMPHHVSDECLSELAVCSYKARRLPLSVLRQAVRSVYEPNEYPSNMQRLYQWTPDECIPEFYCDPHIFNSLHSGMPDLAVPSWAGTSEEFVKLHRDALESNRVSLQMHKWIDITFGYKMSGEAAIAAKNVMLPASTSNVPRSTGRRQLFSQPHPPRQIARRKTHHNNNGQPENNSQSEVDSVEGGDFLIKTNHLNKLEEATSFCEKSWHLDPCYNVHSSDCLKNNTSENELSTDIGRNVSPRKPDSTRNYCEKSTIDSNSLLENIEEGDDSVGYQELMLWRQACSPKINSKRAADDIFSVGCILAELHMGKPLFGSSSLASYLDSGILPGSVQDIPHHMKVIVKACIENDWKRRPSVKCLLESPYFPKSVKSSYYFLAAFHGLSRNDLRLQYAATFAKQGALKRMGAFGAAMCAPYCLPLIVTSASDAEAEWAYLLLAEFLKCLKSEAVMKFVVPSVQRVLQGTGYSHLKVSLLQGSFMQDLWNRIGKQAYFETIHLLIISNLCIAPHKSSTSAASVLLIGFSEELGVPVTVHQTILPLMLSFGKGICNDGIDVLIRIGGLIGEKFVVKQILPLLNTVVNSCICTLSVSKPEPVQSWGSSALIDCLTTLDGLVPVLTTETIVKELIEDRDSPYVKIIMHRDIGIQVRQNATKSLIRVCQQIGPDSTALHVLPNLKELFDEFAFSQKNTYSVNLTGNMSGSKVKVGEEDCIENRMDLWLLLYPQFASLLGIERLRQCCATWLLIEQFLLRHHNWRWECAGDSYRSVPDSPSGRRLSQKGSASENTSAKLLLNGVGWSRPQSQGKKSTKTITPSKSMYELYQNPAERIGTTSSLGLQEPWYWFPSPASNWNGLDFATRAGGLKDELPWKIRASIVQSVRAHHGALRSFAVCQNEYTVFTAGVGPGFKGNIQKWDLSRVYCMSSYNGHDEVVNDIFDLASSGRVASCDGTVHIWNGQTGRLISIFSERSLASSTQLAERDEDNMLHFNPLPSGMLSSAFHGNSYTTMDYLGFSDRLIVGTGNGSLRFIDVNQGQKLHLWRSECVDSGFPPIISSICSSSSVRMSPEESMGFPSWIAAASSTGQCRLFDLRSGKIISSWQAHDGYVTELAATADYQLVSSSLDKTLRIWDLRRNWSSEQRVFRGYSDGVSGFSVWGQNIISICRNKIGLSSLQSHADEDGHYRASLQHVYMADGEAKNASVLSAITILPFSRLFLLGTEDGYLKICC